jgi:NAD-dependent SIR2 family protein deacetylase
MVGGVVKPKITFFGEDLPQRYHRLNGPDLEAADLVIVMGTSLQAIRCYYLILPYIVIM